MVKLCLETAKPAPKLQPGGGEEHGCHSNTAASPTATGKLERETYQPVELSDADVIRVYHAELSPRNQVQTELPKRANTHNI